MVTKTKEVPRFDHLYHLCNDTAAIKEFYSDILGMKCEYNGDYVSLEGAVTMLFFKGDYEMNTDKEWAWQPGNPQAAEGHVSSWSIRICEADFPGVVQTLLENKKHPTLQEAPMWLRDSYWGLTVKDPMGNTVEVYSVPRTKPDSLEWQL